MKIHLNIANGWKRGQLQKWFQENPEASVDPVARNNAIQLWAQERYGPWLAKNEITEYAFYSVTADYVRVEFLHDDDAKAFMKKCGGTVVEE